MRVKSFKKLFQKLSLKKRSRSLEARPLTILDILHAELIIYMAQFLPLSSEVLFTLSCRSACAILGTRSWARLQAKDQRQQHFEFLSQLSKDFPSDYVPCYHCRILHLCIIRYTPPLPAEPHYQHDMTACVEAEARGHISTYINSSFMFRTLQMALKTHRLGLDYEPWLGFLCGQPTAPRMYRLMKKFPSELKTDARIVEGSLLLRSQRIILLPHDRTIRDLDRCLFVLCPHIRVVARGSVGAQTNLPKTVRCALNHDHGLWRCVRKSSVVSCPACPTEYNFRLQECGMFGVAAIITKWKDFGEGQTVLDPRWWSHLSSKYTSSGIFEGVGGINGKRLVDRDPVQSNFGSIREAFGEDRGSSGLDPMLPLERAETLYRMPKPDLPFDHATYLLWSRQVARGI